MQVVSVFVESPSVTVMSLVNTGSRFESKKNNGISHFLEHMCFKGTTSQSGKDIMRYLDGLGAETNAFTSYELTGYYVKSTKKHWKKTLNVVSDIYLNSTFPEEEMNKEKGVIIGEISMYEDMPMRQVQEVFNELVYGDTQSAGWTILGPRTNINRMKRTDFLDYHRDHYVASATTLVVAGNVVHADVVREVEKRFRTISSSQKHTKDQAQVIQSAPRIQVVHKKTDQTHIVFGYHTPGVHHRDTITLKVLASLLGGGMSSRLFERLREDMGVGYYVNAHHNPQTDTGTFTISCGVDSTRVAEVLSAIQDEVQTITNTPVVFQELEKTKEFMIGNIQMGLEVTDDIAYYYGQRALFGLPLSTPPELARDINNVTPEALRRIARKYLVLEHLNIAMIGPHTKNTQTRFITTLKKRT